MTLKRLLKSQNVVGDEMNVSSDNLKRYCAEVPEGESVLRLVAGMLKVCEERDGWGLAANQVGVMKRVIVVRFSGFTQALINPEITRAWGGMNCVEEGCLSFPCKYVPVFRHRRITIKGFDVLWNPVEYHWKNTLARIAQHEVDHLDGVTMYDKRADIHRFAGNS